ncbi:MAG: tRNA 2-thiouridine(34) synthase MnmA [Vicinamibacterales bacterium]
MRVVVAMSGGVDSTVAAAVLAEQGHEVIGLSMQLYDQSEGDTRFGSCCTLDDLHDARRAAALLGIPHYIVNMERVFEQRVVDRFVTSYVEGRTPIPCVACNSDVKFATLLERAMGLEADSLATGHYVRLDRGTDGRWRLRRAVDATKDQAYFLFPLTQAQLAHASFPLGSWTKTDVRDYARRRGLPVADKPDSHEICFVQTGRYAEFVEARAGVATPPAGEITDTAGRTLGRHHGIHRYTVGQRKGLGISATIPLYVLEIDAGRNRVVVGDRAELGARSLVAREVNWIGGTPPTGPIVVNAQIRHRHQAAPATVEPRGGDGARVSFEEPQMAVTPGQAVVFYDGDVMLGGGWIE